MPVSMQAEQTITQFLELLAAFRLKEAGELVLKIFGTISPGPIGWRGRAGLEILGRLSAGGASGRLEAGGAGPAVH